MDGKIRRVTKPDNRLARLNKSRNEKEANINKKLVTCGPNKEFVCINSSLKPKA